MGGGLPRGQVITLSRSGMLIEIFYFFGRYYVFTLRFIYFVTKV
jgi:hypothetical protein